MVGGLCVSAKTKCALALLACCLTNYLPFRVAHFHCCLSFIGFEKLGVWVALKIRISKVFFNHSS